MGKLNILQHKSWHVYSQKNRNRVLRDVRQAKLDEEKRELDSRLEQSEKRLEILRSRKRSYNHIENSEPNSNTIFSESSHKNDNSEIIKKSKKDTECDKYTVYLGETTDGKKSYPWYTKSHLSNSFSDPSKRSEKVNEKDNKLKKSEDPLLQFKKINLERKSDIQIAEEAAREDAVTLRAGRPLSSQYNSEIDKLRSQRIQREKKERLKQNELLKSNPSKSSNTSRGILGAHYTQEYKMGIQKEIPKSLNKDSLTSYQGRASLNLNTSYLKSLSRR